MSKRDLKLEETTQELPSLSTDATRTDPDAHTTGLRLRTHIRAGVSFDWQNLFGTSEGDPGRV